MAAFFCYDHLFQYAICFLQINTICSISNKICSNGRKTSEVRFQVSTNLSHVFCSTEVIANILWCWTYLNHHFSLCYFYTESSLCFAFQLRHLTLLLDVTFHVLWRHPWSNLVKTLFQQSVVLMLKPLLFCLASCHSSAWFPWQWYHDTSTGKS